MNQKILEFERAQAKPKVPDLRPGDTVRVYQKIQEGGKSRTHQFQGVVLATKHGRGTRGSFTVRKIGADGVGVEQVFFFHAPSIFKVDRIRRGDPRRAKLYYLRRLTRKATRKIKGVASSEVWEASGPSGLEARREEVVKPAPIEVTEADVAVAPAAPKTESGHPTSIDDKEKQES